MSSFPGVSEQTNEVHAARAGYSAEVLRVIDGDTFEARVQVWPGIAITPKVRLRGVDAPELHRARCAEKRARAEAARDALKKILDRGEVGIRAVALDKYGRVVADAFARATPDVSRRRCSRLALRAAMESARHGARRS